MPARPRRHAGAFAELRIRAEAEDEASAVLKALPSVRRERELLRVPGEAAGLRLHEHGTRLHRLRVALVDEVGSGDALEEAEVVVDERPPCERRVGVDEDDFSPARAVKTAALAPAGPPPTMATSYFIPHEKHAATKPTHAGNASRQEWTITRQHDLLPRGSRNGPELAGPFTA